MNLSQKNALNQFFPLPDRTKHEYIDGSGDRFLLLTRSHKPCGSTIRDDLLLPVTYRSVYISSIHISFLHSIFYLPGNYDNLLNRLLFVVTELRNGHLYTDDSI